MTLISKKETRDKMGVIEEGNNTNNGYISKTKKFNRHILDNFYSTVESREFYDLAEAVLAEI